MGLIDNYFQLLFRSVINFSFLRLSWILKILLLVGRICNDFEKNRAFYDKSMKLGTWLVDNKTKNKGQCHAENAL